MKKVILLITLLFSFGSFFFLRGNNPHDKDRLKARSFYLEGARQAALGNNPEAFELFKKAYALDSTYFEAAYNYGTTRLILPTDTLQSETELLRSLNLIREYVDANPEDIHAGMVYGYISTRLDTIEEAIRVYERMTDLLPSETYLLLSLADSYMQHHKTDSVIKALKKYENIEGKSEEVSMKIMSAMLIKGDTISAINEARDLVESNPRNPDFLMLAGNLYSLVGKNDSTLSFFRRAENVAPDKGTVKIHLAGYYLAEGDSVAYDRKMYEALLSEDFQLQDKLSILGTYLKTLIDDQADTSRGDYLFDVLMEQYPHEPQILDLAAKYNAALGNLDEAAAKISYAIDQDPANPDYWISLLRYNIADSNYKEVVANYQRALDHIVPSEDMSMIYALALSELKDYEEAEKIYMRLIKELVPDINDPGPVTNDALRRNLGYYEIGQVSNYYNMLGDMYYKAGEPEKAFTAYDNSLFFYPDNILTLNNYAYFLAQNGGDLDKALQMSKKAISEAQDNPTYLDTYAWILFMKKEYKEALDTQSLAIEKAKELGDDNAEYYHHMGDILFMNHQLEEALENWKHALELEPDNELLKKKVSHKTFFFE